MVMRIEVSEFVNKTLHDFRFLQSEQRFFARTVFTNKLKQFNNVLVSLVLVGGWGVLICLLRLEPLPDNWNQVEGILRTDEIYL